MSKENHLIFETLDNGFLARVWEHIVSTWFAITLLVISAAFVFTMSVNTLAIIIFLGFFLFIIQQAFYWNVYFVSFLKADKSGVAIKYTKYGKELEVSIPVEELRLKITPVHVKERRFKLKVYQNNELMIRLYQWGYWTEEKFEEIEKAVYGSKRYVKY